MKYFPNFFCLLCFLLLLNFYAAAQQNTFEKTWGGNGNDVGHFTLLSNDGNMVVTGAKTNANDPFPDLYIAKISIIGEIIWENTFETTYEAGGNEIVAAENGNYFIAGHVDITGEDACDALFIMVNALGDTLWSNTYGFDEDDVAYACTKANDGGYISVGKVALAGNANAFVCKHNDAGDLLWVKIFGDAEEDFATSVKQVEDGYFVSGRYTTNNNTDFWLMKLNNAGDLIWEKKYDSPEKDYPYSLEIAADGGCLMAGKEDLGNGITTIYLLRTNSEGNLIWETKYGNNNSDFAKGIERANNGDWIISGTLYNVNNQSQDMMMMEVNDDGIISSIRFFGDDMKQVGNSICSDGTGGYLITGTSENMSMQNTDIMLLRTDENGIVNSIVENNGHAGMEITAYPNPCTNIINFTIANPAVNMQFNLMDSNGKIILYLDKLISQQFSVPTNNISNGLYFYSLVTDNLSSSSYGKIVILN